MLDENNYPDEASLEQIENYDVLTRDVEGLLTLIEDNTNWADRQTHRQGKNVIDYRYNTGGWSGNEDVIDALHHNFIFWSMFWRQSNAGGHYKFKIDKRLLKASVKK